jgi:hypothetical protein
MLHRSNSLRVALTSLALLALSLPAIAQQAPQDRVPLKVYIKGSPQGPPAFLIPLDPPLSIANVTWPGQSELLGPISFIETDQIQLGTDGAPISSNGIGVIQAANSDSLFVRWLGLVRLTATGMACEHSFVITGGKGRFVGASGNGAMKGELDFTKNEGWLNLEGVVSKPAAKAQ